MVAGYALIRGDRKSCGCLNRELMAVFPRTTHGLSYTPEYRLWRNAKRRAEDLSLPFNIVVSDVVVPEVCPYLGIRLHPSMGRANAASPTLDRIIPARGYVRGNIQVISFRANVIKSVASFEEFERIYFAWKSQGHQHERESA